MNMRICQVANEQSYNHSIMQKYNEIIRNYSSLQENTRLVYDENIEKIEYRIKLKNHVDNIAISNEDKTLFLKYTNDKNIAIEKYLSNGNFNLEKVEKLFEIRLKGLKRKKERLNINNIGTVMNTLKDLHHDVFMDIDRNKYRYKERPKELNASWIDFKIDEINLSNEPRTNYEFSLK